SRRRHTRFSRDWSSDVCSSDLADTAKLPAGYGRYGQGSFPLPRFGNALAYSCASWHDEHSLEVLARLVETPFAYTLNCKFSPGRSEERRVGKVSTSRAGGHRIS